MDDAPSGVAYDTGFTVTKGPGGVTRLVAFGATYSDDDWNTVHSMAGPISFNPRGGPTGFDSLALADGSLIAFETHGFGQRSTTRTPHGWIDTCAALAGTKQAERHGLGGELGVGGQFLVALAWRGVGTPRMERRVAMGYRCYHPWARRGRPLWRLIGRRASGKE